MNPRTLETVQQQTIPENVQSGVDTGSAVKTVHQRVEYVLPDTPYDDISIVRVNVPEQKVQPSVVSVDQATKAGELAVESALAEVDGMEQMTKTSPNPVYVEGAVFSRNLVVNLLSGAARNPAHIGPVVFGGMIADPALSFGVNAAQNQAYACAIFAFAVACSASFAEIISRRDAAGPGAAFNPSQAFSDTVIGFAPRVGYQLIGVVYHMQPMPVVPFTSSGVVDAFVTGAGRVVTPHTPAFGWMPNSVSSFLGGFASWFSDPTKGVAIINASFTRSVSDLFGAMLSSIVTPLIQGLANLMGPAAGPQSIAQRVVTGVVTGGANAVINNQVVITGLANYASTASSTTAITTAMRAVPTPQVAGAIVLGTVAIRAVQVGPSQAAHEVARPVVNTAAFFYNNPMAAVAVATAGVAAAYVYSNRS